MDVGVVSGDSFAVSFPDFPSLRNKSPNDLLPPLANAENPPPPLKALKAPVEATGFGGGVTGGVLKADLPNADALPKGDAAPNTDFFSSGALVAAPIADGDPKAGLAEPSVGALGVAGADAKADTEPPNALGVGVLGLKKGDDEGTALPKAPNPASSLAKPVGWLDKPANAPGDVCGDGLNGDEAGVVVTLSGFSGVTGTEKRWRGFGRRRPTSKYRNRLCRRFRCL